MSEKICRRCGIVLGYTNARLYQSGGRVYLYSYCLKCESQKVMQRERWRRDDDSRRREARRQRKYYKFLVIYDPSNLFTGGVFAGYDFKFTLKRGGWPTGMIVSRAAARKHVLIKNIPYRVEGTKLVQLEDTHGRMYRTGG